jgi:hypothetical protein
MSAFPFVILPLNLFVELYNTHHKELCRGLISAPSIVEQEN